VRKRPRPTVQDAEKFLRDGYFLSGPDHVSWQDREKELHEFRMATETLLKERLSKSRNLVLVILTSHIIAEFLLNKFIEFAAPTQTDMARERFTFTQKVTLFHMLGFARHPVFIPTLDVLNRLRNQVAHSLNLDRSQVDWLIRAHDLTPEGRSELTDRDRVRSIKAITRYMCGMVFGVIYAQNLLEFENRHRSARMPVDDNDNSFLKNTRPI
jgi:hypothetical protein